MKRPLSHATLLTGTSGVGLKTIALEIAKNYNQLPAVAPELLTKTSTLPQIGVDVIRSLYEQTRGKSQKDTLVIIDEADLMSQSAQHSFLKLLEEPSSSSHFILTSHHPEALLPTVRSRVQTIHVPTISEAMTNTLLDSIPSLSDVKRKQLLFAASGLPAELLRLAHDEEYFQATASLMAQAKALIQGTPYERLVTISKLKAQRLEALTLIEKAIHILSLQPTAQSIRQTKHLLRAYEHIKAGGNVRLQLTSNMLQ